ncbi:DUF1572 domain-containing protein [Flavobacterium sp. CBA20B-1]|uniref:DUF1572 domain-containing protein n=1 Tax=unclassified Flavobacterium TaxID=196869 RepID=UPI0022248E52|nr:MULTISPECIES: DUF1572 domain-containing protein [unclassified Flavobacterium]WCM40953.1 DUF1572 domain-containing protein [Flavobacterium sp. CBA20B-1]
MESTFIESVKKQFAYYKHLGDKTFEQLHETDFFWQFNEESNSIAIIVKHLWGNMLSRWTDIFTTDGEKEWRNRDSEFEADLNSANEVLEKWEAGWNCLFATLNSLSDADLNKIVYIRNEGHTVQEAINRQLAHYPYHVGQIVFIGKMIQNNNWHSLSIPRNESQKYNANKFSTVKQRKHFTDDLLNDKHQK